MAMRSFKALNLNTKTLKKNKTEYQNFSVQNHCYYHHHMKNLITTHFRSESFYPSKNIKTFFFHFFFLFGFQRNIRQHEFDEEKQIK